MEKMGPPQLFFISVDRFSIGFLDIAVGGARARRVVHFLRKEWYYSEFEEETEDPSKEIWHAFS